MKILTVALVAGLLLAFIPNAQAVPGPGVGNCEVYRHISVVSIALQIQAGDNEIWSHNPACGTARSPTQVLQWTGQFSGPVVLGAATMTWANNGFTGCTLSTITSVNSALLGSANSVATATITMTSDECRGSISFTINIPAIYTWNAILPVNIQVAPPVSGELDIHQDPITGELDIHQDEACGATIPCVHDLGGGNVSSNSTLFGDTRAAIADWIPLFIAFAILAISTMRRKPNYQMVIMSGGFFAYAAFSCPFDTTGMRLLIGIFGGYLALLGALELREPETDQAMEG